MFKNKIDEEELNTKIDDLIDIISNKMEVIQAKMEYEQATFLIG